MKENSMNVSEKIQIELPYDAFISLLGMYMKETKILPQKNFQGWMNG